MNNFKKIGEQIGEFVDEKNQAYGNSFDQCGNFLKMLYPNGIPTEHFDDMLCVIRCFDKFKRIATKKDAFGEEPYVDLLGIAIRMIDNQLNKEEDK